MRRPVWLALVIVSGAILAITLWPTPVDAPAHDTIGEVLTSLHRAGVPQAINYSFVEVSSNVVMFVPLGAVLTLLLPRKRWWIAPLVACATSSLIELTQLVFLPHRFATISDVMANTTGALLGSLGVLTIRVTRARRAANKA